MYSAEKSGLRTEADWHVELRDRGYTLGYMSA